MDRAELRGRLRQELAKRQDALLAFTGYGFASRIHTASAEKPYRFFFTPGSVDSILAILTQRFPDYSTRIVQQADRICRHQFDLLGYPNLDYGHPIQWHLDAVHGKLAPRKAFYRVRYLDFAEVGDSKVTWELSRHQHLVTLAKAYRLTGELKYADEILRQWRHWKEDNPYPRGINWASSLEAAFRALSWVWTYYLLQGAAGIPDFRRELVRAVALHGRHVERYLSTYFSPNTHLLGEGVGLFFLGVLFPELPSSERWKSVGKEIVLQEAQRQVRSDGFHFEQSTYYHVYALDFFLHTAVLAAVNEIPLPKDFEDTIERMLTALCLLARHGTPPRFGDDDGGRLFDPQRNRSEHMLDPLAAGAILFHRGDFKSAAGELREETIWLLGAEGVRQWDALTPEGVPNNSVAFPETGFYLLAAEQSQVVVNTGPVRKRRGGHSHADALSINLQSQGRSVLIDPGTYEYIGPGDDRNTFRGTPIHNTVTVDGVSQSDPAGPFAWQKETNAQVERWIQGKNFNLVVASHDGYQRLPQPVTHRRWVISLEGGIFLVRDVISGQGKHRVDLAFHLGPDLQRTKGGILRGKDSELAIALLTPQMKNWTEEIRETVWSPVYGQKSSTTVLNLSVETALPVELAILLVAREGTIANPGTFVRLQESEKSGAEVAAYKYSAADLECTFFFGPGGTPWRHNQLSSDAEFVCCQRTANSPDERLSGDGSFDEHWILCRGSFARVANGRELNCSHPVEWAEWIKKRDSSAIYSSDRSAVEMPDGTVQADAVSVSSPLPE